jgi:hypothetical protein
MGASLAKRIWQPEWSHLSDSARNVLHYMCLTALDTASSEGNSPRQYYAGHSPIIFALSGGADIGSIEWKNAKRRVARAVKELIEADAIEKLSPAHRSNKTKYEIFPDSPFNITD